MFPPQDLTGLALALTVEGRSAGWGGTASCTVSESAGCRVPKFRQFKEVLRFPDIAELIAVKMHRQLIRVPPDPGVNWPVVDFDGGA